MSLSSCYALNIDSSKKAATESENKMIADWPFRTVVESETDSRMCRVVMLLSVPSVVV